MQKLKSSGYLRERSRRIGDVSILHIGTKAFAALREAGRLERFPGVNATAFEKRGQVSELTLRHELEVMDVRAAFFRAVREQPHLTIVEFSTWPTLYQFSAEHESREHGRRELLVKPDGFVRIREVVSDGTFEQFFFLEVDRSTETLETITQKMECYRYHYKSGLFAVKWGGTACC